MNVTLEDARALAKELKAQSPKVLGVELFGSVRRKGIGHDVDFIVLVDTDIARTWWADMSDIRVTWPPQLHFLRSLFKIAFYTLDESLVRVKKDWRQARTSALLGVDLVALGEAYRPGTYVDVWLMPLDWRTGTKLNRALMERIADIKNDSNTLAFFRNVARIALPLG